MNSRSYELLVQVLRIVLFTYSDQLIIVLCRFFTYYEKIRDDESKERKLTPHAAFRQFDMKKKNYITNEDIAKLSTRLIERVVKKFIRPGYTKEREQRPRDEL